MEGGNFAGCSHPQAFKRSLHCQPEVHFHSTPPTYIRNAIAIYEAFDIFACIISISLTQVRGFPGGSEGKEPACNAGDLVSKPGLGRSPEGRERLPTPVFWPREFPGLYSPWGPKESDTIE